MDFKSDLKPVYEELKEAFRLCSYSDEVTDILEKLFYMTNSYLESCDKVPLKSRVNNKEYFLYDNGTGKSRAINSLLYNEWEDKQKNDQLINKFWENVRVNKINKQSPHDITVAVYIIAISFCATVDL